MAEEAGVVIVEGALMIATLAWMMVFSNLALEIRQPWRDPSPHHVSFVTVQPHVRVEVLDWGGDGDVVLLLAGHGDTAHVFDDFAPRLVASGFRVLALTRRGFGASSQPEGGYDMISLTSDIVRVIEARRLRRVHLVGHSIAGDEMTRLAHTHPEKLQTLVFLDAAYDRIEARDIEATFPPLPPLPEPPPAQLSSPARVREYVERTTILMPESEIRATRVFSSDGRLVRSVTPDRILRALASAVEHPVYEKLRAPVLAIYAVPVTPGQLVPRYRQGYESGDEKVKAPLNAIFETWKRSAAAQRSRFRKAVPHARVIELTGASHYAFISHENDVLDEIVRFLRQNRYND